ncbi:GNAT family N-acetyltransferase [Beggiatoa leptomitoformis]|uniref:GNAT family N-acetyltransferase n=1 Tax=Beggiatoa leptomitoformis TaxID=288004 RepID=A0A2N9YFD9_9GAMM|nr:GNAT family N-acetyltransferase [Beggiatoa leptomitoformis]ALG68466.1 GNAT family N-acetyltransferase [Beggiatoa leptomitoformis]AUI69202.1 GNAT family N-acetyltransferase [Beggiatoa leptomitoformis]
MNIPNTLLINYSQSLTDVSATDWNQLRGMENPFVRHEFLLALEEEGCLHQYGWQPFHVLVYAEERLIGAMPLYIKMNSYGEFVFDWSWADAYQKVTGNPYYPKLVCATPYTPATGARLLVAPDVEWQTIADLLLDGALALAKKLNVSGLHVLFTDSTDTDYLIKQRHLMARLGCQFHWDNENYQDFDDFLSKLTSKRRKQIKKERREAQQSGVTIEILDGHQATDAHWEQFHAFYSSTFERKSGVPTLSLAFFKTISKTMPDNIVLVMARLGDEYVASAFNLRGSHTLYGRHWGCSAHFPHLHFELCYYQTIDYCIKNKLTRFEAGAQGEHKISRGFLPTPTWSAHWLADERFTHIVQRFLTQETPAIEAYMADLWEHSPFKEDGE